MQERKKKLIARESWYKNDENNDPPSENENKQRKYKNRKGVRTNEYPVQSVMFLPYTQGGGVGEKTERK